MIWGPRNKTWALLLRMDAFIEKEKMYIFTERKGAINTKDWTEVM